MYRASDRLEHDTWLADLDAAADQLDLNPDARSAATELFLTDVPDSRRSKQAAVAASLYAGALIAGDRRSQASVADAVGVSRVAVQQHWKHRLRAAGLDAPQW